MVEYRFRHLNFTVAQSDFAVSADIQFLRVDTNGAFSSFRVDDHVQLRKPLLVALRLSVVSLIDIMDINEIVYDHAYDS